ncbi:LOW QUALITY PROTEIN: T-cell antigen CD7 [Sciurus carolinensis]|uniref:LOW QUALITY PROTEIN: T-cell antigen CD7 n=1 Tax=Sciurus carolinensis TaxID=30640 RepID=UPI001FB55CDC|nr:LOW QUALITY PROTEIN: T-cell antigen CD7 [Sciurus carolinensis]
MALLLLLASALVWDPGCPRWGEVAGSLVLQAPRPLGAAPNRDTAATEGHPSVPAIVPQRGCPLLFCPACGDSSRPSTEVQQCPRYTALPEGASVNITCCTSGPLQGIYLRRSWPQTTNVIYYEDNRPSTVDQQFQGRVHLSGTQDNLTITMHRLQRADLGHLHLRGCAGCHVLGPGTMLMKKTAQVVHRCQEPLPTSLALPHCPGCGLLPHGLGLGVLCTLRRTQIKGMCTSRDKSSASVVYEDMSYSRCNTLSTPNQYQ